MKKLINSAFALLLAGTMFSCAKETTETNGTIDPNTPKSSMVVTLGLGTEKSDSEATRAGDALRPITAFKNGDKISLLLFPSTTGLVSQIRTITYVAGTSAYTLKDVPTTLTQVVALMGETVVGGEVVEHTSFLGKTAKDIMFNLKAEGVQFAAPTDVFTSPMTETNIASPSASASLALSRVVSLSRVIVLKSELPEHKPFLDKLVLEDTKNVMILRKGTNQIGLTGVADKNFVLTGNAGITSTLGFYTTLNIPSGYEGAALTKADAWKDFNIFPYASATGKMNLVLGIKAKAGYLLSNGTTLAADKILYFQGEVVVGSDITRNKIVEISVNFSGTNGSEEIPEVGEYSDFTANITLEGWDKTVIDASTNM